MKTSTKRKRIDLLRLRALAHQRWRVLLAYPPMSNEVRRVLGSLHKRAPELRRALAQWEVAALSLEAGSVTAPPEFRSALCKLAELVTPLDRFGHRATALFAATRARLSNQPGAVAEAHLRNVSDVFARYVELRNRLVQAHLGLVCQTVGRMKIPPERTDDMIHEGMFGLVRALECFDPNRGTQFSTYAVYWIRTEIMRALDLHLRQIRVPYHVLCNRRAFLRSMQTLQTRGESTPTELRRRAREATGLTPSQLDAVEAVPLAVDAPELEEHPGLVAEDAAAQLDQRILVQRLEAAFPSLSVRERVVVEHRFELNGHPFETLEQLGARLGLSRERVRQIESNALDKLRSHLTTRAPRPPSLGDWKSMGTATAA